MGEPRAAAGAAPIDGLLEEGDLLGVERPAVEFLPGHRLEPAGRPGQVGEEVQAGLVPVEEGPGHGGVP